MRLFERVSGVVAELNEELVQIDVSRPALDLNLRYSYSAPFSR